MACLLIGHIPVLLKPALMLAGVIAFSQATLNTWKNSDLVIPLAPVALLNLHIASLNASLKPLKGFLSKGFPQCEVCGSMGKHLMFLSYIIDMYL